MINKIEVYFLLFISYAFLGWCLEVICKAIQYKKFINRGFLIGPYCPIYGWGALAITILLQKYLEDPLVLFIMAILICSVIEYITSYYMEKRYHARWWDYSDKKFNINGRICLETMIPFGVLGCLIMYIVNPFLSEIYSKIPMLVAHIIAMVLCIIFIVDNIISSHIISNVRVEAKKMQKDNTEEITERVKEILRKKSFLHRRLVKAFPHIQNIRVRKARQK